MLRVVVESAKGLPKKKVGSPDPITSVIFKGKRLSLKRLNFKYSPCEVTLEVNGTFIVNGWWQLIQDNDFIAIKDTQ